MQKTPLTRLEVLLAAAIVIVAFAARAAFLTHAGIDQYDEGVYAFSGLGLSDASQPHRLYPGQVRFAPPAYFGLVGLAFGALGSSALIAILINIILGTLTVAAVWWAGRRWFGAPAGIAAALLLALNESHITLSRSALTDVAFGFFFLVALIALVEALERESLPLSVVAGLATGIAWNTKYHGWFAILIAGAAMVARSWLRRKQQPLRWRPYLLLAVSAVIAGLCYLPWMLFIRSQPGSVEGLASYYMTMLSGEWFANLWRHVRMQYFLEGPLSRVSVPLALLGAAVMVRPAFSQRRELLLAGAAIVLALTLGAAGTMAVLSVALIAAGVRARASLPLLLLFALFGLWFFAAPVYHPYFRLLLPFTIAACIGAGAYLQQLLLAPAPVPATRPRFYWAAAAAALTLLIAIRLPDPSNPWRDARSAADAAATITRHVPEGKSVLVVGEPPVAFYLHTSARPSFRGVEKKAVLDTLQGPIYLVTGRYAQAVPGIRKWLSAHATELQHLATIPFFPRDLRLLDDFDPRRARELVATRDTTFDLRLYLYEPHAATAIKGSTPDTAHPHRQ